MERPTTSGASPHDKRARTASLPARPIHADRYASLGELLHDALVQFKSETALVEMDRKREHARWSYLEVKREAEALAGRLAARGIGAGGRVAILMGNQGRWLIAACAAFFRGAVLVPIDYKLDPEEQQALLAHCGAEVLFTEYPLWRRLGSAQACHAIVSDVPEGTDPGGAERWEDGPADAAAAAPPELVPRHRDDVATIVYSSGTGGRPKGCMLTHGNYLAQYQSLANLFPIVVGDRYFSILPTNHAIDFMVGFLGPFGGGATVVHQRTLRPEMVRDTLRRCRITHMAVVPRILEGLERAVRERLEAQSPGKQRAFDLLRSLNATLTMKRPQHGLSRRLLAPVHDAFGGHLRLVICGGAPVDADRARFFYELGIPVVIGYGLTEAGTAVTVNDLSPFRADSVGKPLEGMEVAIRDADPDSGIGEVWVRGPTVMKGYLDEPELTAQALVDGWLRTGDAGWIDASGQLHLVGRRKNMIVTAGGKNVYPEDVEGAFDGLPCEELAVMAGGYLWPGAAASERLLLVVHRPGDGFEADLRARNRRLPEHKRIAGVLEWPASFPRTASMKIKRDALAEALRSGARAEQVREV
ncbi:MAG: AMP-dependent synthetase/ligase [Myxococcota bacterium]